MESSPAHDFWAGTPVCVLGGTGFLGRHLVRSLLNAGARVRTLSLPGAGLGWPGVDERTGDATDAATVRATADGCRVVFLAAGPVGVGGSLSRVMDAHAVALNRVLDALPDDARLVLTSSIVTVGATQRGAVLSESSSFPNAGLQVGYVRAKRAAEDAAVAAAGHGRDVVVVNPGYLFGPDDPRPSIMGGLCLKFWRGRIAFAPPGGLNAVDVRDVAAGHLLAAEHGESGRRYILGGQNVSLAELFAELARAAGLRRVLMSQFRPTMPSWAMWSLAAVSELSHRVTGKDPFPSFELVRMNRLSWFVSSARAEDELGYRPRRLSVTLSDTFAWHAARTRVAPRGLNRLWLRRAA